MSSPTRCAVQSDAAECIRLVHPNDEYVELLAR